MDQIENRMQKYEDNLHITRSQQKQIRGAIIRQVNALLSIKFEGGVVADESIEDAVLYRGGFISRLYCEAKRAGILADCTSETPRGDFDKCMEYITSWHPGVAGGVEGYKAYLDKLRWKREQQKREGKKRIRQ